MTNEPNGSALVELRANETLGSRLQRARQLGTSVMLTSVDGIRIVRLTLSDLKEIDGEYCFSGLFYDADFFGRTLGVWPYEARATVSCGRCVVRLHHRGNG